MERDLTYTLFLIKCYNSKDLRRIIDLLLYLREIRWFNSVFGLFLIIVSYYIVLIFIRLLLHLVLKKVVKHIVPKKRKNLNLRTKSYTLLKIDTETQKLWKIKKLLLKAPKLLLYMDKITSKWII